MNLDEDLADMAVYGLIATLIVAVMFIALLAGCAQTPVIAPSTKPLQSDLSHAQANISQAKTLAQRIHDKDVIIDMWNKQHQSQ